MTVLALAAAFVLAGSALAIVALRTPSEPPTHQDRVLAVAATLRCPVCQGLSVADSPSGLARQMRGQIASRLGAGATPEEVKAEFVRSYGEWILLAPPKRGINLLVWVAPALVLLAGLVGAGLALRRWTAGTGTEATGSSPNPNGLAPADQRLLDQAVAASDGEGE